MNSNLKNLSSTLKCFIVKLAGEFAGKRRVQEPSLISFLKLGGTYQCALKGFSGRAGQLSMREEEEGVSAAEQASREGGGI